MAVERKRGQRDLSLETVNPSGPFFGDHWQDAGALQQLFGLGLGIGDAHGAWVPCVFVRTPILTDAPRANVSVAAASNLSISREPGFA